MSAPLRFSSTKPEEKGKKMQAWYSNGILLSPIAFDFEDFFRHRFVNEC